MRAVLFAPGGGVELGEVPEPTAGPGELVVAPRAVGICGSDLLDWYAATKAGSVAGHELAAQVVAVGEGVLGFAPGDRVVPHHHAPCGACVACRRDRFVQCAAWRASRLDPGGMAERVRVPAGNVARDTWKIPPGLTDDEAVFTEPLATVVKAFRRGRFHHDDRLLVVGLGTAGQLAVRYARRLGAEHVAGADRAASRLALAAASGADATIDVGGETLAEGARRVTGGEGFDFVFICPGKSAVVLDALEAVAPGGTLLLFTMPAPGDALALDGNRLYFREVQLVPSYSCGPVEMKVALTLLSEKRIAVADLVTQRFPLGQARAAFDRAREAEGSLKVLLDFAG
jgi:L-iditol 2-dehydrogenase